MHSIPARDGPAGTWKKKMHGVIHHDTQRHGDDDRQTEVDLSDQNSPHTEGQGRWRQVGNEAEPPKLDAPEREDERKGNE